MIICKKCGTQNTGGDQFCGNCGAFLEWEGEVIPPEGGTPPAAATEVTQPVPDPYATTVSPPAPPPSPTVVAPTVGLGPICGNCGLQNDPGLTFCRRCGADLAAGAVATTPVYATPGTSGAEGDAGAGRKVPIVPILVGGLVIGVVLVGLVMFVGGGGPGPSSSPSGSGVAIGSGSPEASVAPQSPSPSPSPSATLASAEPSVPASAEPSASVGPTIEPSAAPVPDLIAFESNLAATAAKPRFDVFVANPDGTNIQRVTTGGTANNYPTWSPDRTKIAYYTNISSPSSIYISTIDGSSTIPLFEEGGSQSGKNDTTPAWSPDGTRIAFVRPFHGIRQIYIATVDPSTGAAVGNPKKLTEEDFEQLRPAWSPDGTLLVYRGPGADLFVISSVPASGKDPTRLTTSGDKADREPAWSPSTTNRAIAFSRSSGAQADIFVVDVDAKGKADGPPRRLTNADGQERWPAWSPDGAAILYWADEGQDDTEVRHLYRMTAAGKNRVQVIKDDEPLSFDPAWN